MLMIDWIDAVRFRLSLFTLFPPNRSSRRRRQSPLPSIEQLEVRILPSATSLNSFDFAWNFDRSAENETLDDNQPPQAVANIDQYFIGHDRPLDSNGQATYGYDPDGDPVTLQLAQDVQHGTLTLNSDASFTYLPDEHFVGNDSFQVLYTDSYGAGSNIVTLNISVTNEAPSAFANNYQYAMLHDRTLDSNGQATYAYDPDNDALTLNLVQDVQHGTLTLNSDGSFLYTPDQQFVGTDSFEVQYTDTVGAASNLITINLDVTNAAPSVYASTEEYFILHDQTLVPQGAAIDVIDPDGDALTLNLLQDVQHGTLVLNADGSFTYTPEDHFVGSDSFEVQYTDTAGATSNSITLTLHVTNQPPVVNDTTALTLMSTDVELDLQSLMSDADADPLAINIVSGPLHGILTVDENGLYIYIPNDEFEGTDTFTWTATDGAQQSQTGTVTIYVVSLTLEIVSVEDDSASVTIEVPYSPESQAMQSSLQGMSLQEDEDDPVVTQDPWHKLELKFTPPPGFPPSVLNELTWHLKAVSDGTLLKVQRNGVSMSLQQAIDLGPLTDNTPILIAPTQLGAGPVQLQLVAENSLGKIVGQSPIYATSILPAPAVPTVLDVISNPLLKSADEVVAKAFKPLNDNLTMLQNAVQTDPRWVTLDAIAQLAISDAIDTVQQSVATFQAQTKLLLEGQVTGMLGGIVSPLVTADSILSHPLNLTGQGFGGILQLWATPIQNPIANLIDAAFQGTLQQTVEGIMHHPNRLLSNVSLTYYNMLSDGTAINLSMTMPDLASDDWIQTFDVTGSIIKPPGPNGQFEFGFGLSSDSGSTTLQATIQVSR